MREHYSFDEVRWAKQMLCIKPDSLTAKKLARIGVDLSERKKQAQAILDRVNNEQPVQDK